MTKRTTIRIATRPKRLVDTSMPPKEPAPIVQSAPRSRTLFMVDDLPNSLHGFIEMVEKQHTDWRVEVVHDKDTAMRRLREMSQKLPDLISIDLGLEPLPDSTDIGLNLLRDIHHAFGSRRLVVHSALNVKPEVLHEILGMRVSYIRLRDRQSEEAFADALPWMAEGYLFFSPSVAGQFSEILPEQPDPLDEDEWAVARLLATGKDYEAVARAITDERYEKTGDAGYTLSLSRVSVIVREIADKLRNAGFFKASFDEGSSPNRYKPHIIAFYDKYHVKYRH
jgi:DNA-binding NarL/FixJ family response regulator